MSANDSYGWVRGANYVPSYGATNVEEWNNFDPAIVDRELGFAERLGLNSVRVNLQYLVYERYPKRFLRNVAKFVELCDRHHIRPMLVLFDGCFGTSPSLESAAYWVASPGPDRTNPAFYPLGEKYVRDVLALFRGDSRVLMWDVMNEPTSTYLVNTDEGKKLVWDFVRHFCDYVHKLDSFHPITVGIATFDNADMIDCVDVLSMHSYNKDPEAFRKEIHTAREQAERVGKPLIITECCAPGWGQDYEVAMPIVREEHLGYYVWEVMIARTQFAPIAGLFYPDGTVRRISHAEAVYGGSVPGLVEKPDSEGVPINSGPPVLTLTGPSLKRMAASRTNKHTCAERLSLLKLLSLSSLFGQRNETIAAGVKEAEAMLEAGKTREAYIRLNELLQIAQPALEESASNATKQGQ